MSDSDYDIFENVMELGELKPVFRSAAIRVTCCYKEKPKMIKIRGKDDEKHQREVPLAKFGFTNGFGIIMANAWGDAALELQKKLKKGGKYLITGFKTAPVNPRYGEGDYDYELTFYKTTAIQPLVM